jgi:hypothetical protein
MQYSWPFVSVVVPSDDSFVICIEVVNKPESVRVLQVRPRSVEYSYRVIAEPPLLGAVKFTDNDSLLGVTFVFNGRLIALGTVFGVAETTAEPTLCPIELIALTATS